MPIICRGSLGTGARFVSSNHRLPMNIYNEQTNKNAYVERSEKQTPDFLPRNQIMTGSILWRNITTAERVLVVRSLAMIESVNADFSAVVNYSVVRE